MNSFFHTFIVYRNTLDVTCVLMHKIVYSILLYLDMHVVR